MSRPATREAIEAIDAEMVPDRLQNGTDLRGRAARGGRAARAARRARSRRARCSCSSPTARSATTPTARRSSARSGRARARPRGRGVRRAPRRRRARGGRARATRCARSPRRAAASCASCARARSATRVPALLADLARGGDLAAHPPRRRRRRATPRGEARAGRRPRRRRARSGAPAARVAHRGVAHGQRLAVTPPPPPPSRPTGCARWSPRRRRRSRRGSCARPRWWRWSSRSPTPRRPAEDAVKGSMDRRWCATCCRWRTCRARAPATSTARAATPALRDLTGRVRLAIDLMRGEVDARVESSTLDNAGIERCLREGAFELDVPRAARSDAPVTAVLNLVFRPRTPREGTTTPRRRRSASRSTWSSRSCTAPRRRARRARPRPDANRMLYSTR